MPPKPELYSFCQIKEIISMHQETTMKFFNSTVERLERKINDLVAENHNLRHELAEVKE